LAYRLERRIIRARSTVRALAMHGRPLIADHQLLRTFGMIDPIARFLPATPRASSAFRLNTVEEVVRNGLRNRLLGSLPEADLALLQPHLAPVRLGFRQRLQSANRRVNAVYFPDSGIASVVAIANASRYQAEVAVIGCEGMTGLPVVLRAGRSPCEIFIQVEGHGQCIQAEDSSAR
jgi:hypothetical protein